MLDECPRLRLWLPCNQLKVFSFFLCFFFASFLPATHFAFLALKWPRLIALALSGSEGLVWCQDVSSVSCSSSDAAIPAEIWRENSQPGVSDLFDFELVPSHPLLHLIPPGPWTFF